MRSRSSSRHITSSKMPGLDFFIPVETVNTSRAPAAKIVSVAKPISSAVISSMLQQSSETRLTSSAVSPNIARTQFAISKSFLPIP